MNKFHLTEIPNDIRYIIWSYLNYDEVNLIMKTFEIFIDFERLVSIINPDFYKIIKKLSLDPFVGIYWNLIYSDSERTSNLNMTYYDSVPYNMTIYRNGVLQNEINSHTMNLIGYYKLKKEYPRILSNIIKDAPDGSLSYIEFYYALSFFSFHSKLNTENDIYTYFENIDTWETLKQIIETAHCTMYILYIIIQLIKDKQLILNNENRFLISVTDEESSTDYYKEYVIILREKIDDYIDELKETESENE